MIVVTGATGQVGSALLELLDGEDTRAVAHSVSGRERLESTGVATVEGDFDNPESMLEAMRGADQLFLLSPPHPTQVAREQAAIEAAKEAGVGHVVAVSVLGADVRSPAAFARWHGEIDERLVSSGLRYSILRPAGFMVTHLWPVQTITTQGTWYGMTGDGASAFVDVADVAASAAALLTGGERESGVYELTGPQAVSMPQAAAAVTEVSGREVTYVDLPPEAFAGALASAGLPAFVVDGIVRTYESIRAGHATTVTNWVEQLTGRPARSYGEFVEANRGQLDPS